MTDRPEIPCPNDCDNGTISYFDGGYFSMVDEQWFPREVLGPCERCEGRGTIWPEQLTAEERGQYPDMPGALWVVAP